MQRPRTNRQRRKRPRPESSPKTFSDDLTGNREPLETSRVRPVDPSRLMSETPLACIREETTPAKVWWSVSGHSLRRYFRSCVPGRPTT